MTAPANPFASDLARGPAWESGYEAGYAEPEQDHFPPLEPDEFEVYAQGELAGRTDRRNEPFSATPIPAAGPEVTRFESAPDGTLIPIPDEGPTGNPIRPDASVTISPAREGEFYIVIYNGPPDPEGHAAEIVGEVLQEAAITKLEHLLAEAARIGSHGLLRFGGLFVGVLISVLTPSPILRETRFRGYLEGQLAALQYVVLDPQ